MIDSIRQLLLQNFPIFQNFQLSTEQIYQHFRNFGRIESLTTSYFDNSRYIFIVFANGRSAQAAAAIPKHRIGPKLVDVYLNECYSAFINVNLSMVPPLPEALTHILNSLPDECFLEIFKFLDVKDLSNVADTCTKFRAIARDIFAGEFSEMYENTIDQLDARTLARVLRNFGAYITTFVLDCKKMVFGNSRRYLKQFCEHCAVPEGSLRTLTVKNFSKAHKLEFEKPLQAIILRLKTLKIEGCDGLQFSFGIKSNSISIR